MRVLTKSRRLGFICLVKCMKTIKIVEGESIDSLFTRFTDIVNPLSFISKTFTQEELVTKIL